MNRLNISSEIVNRMKVFESTDDADNGDSTATVCPGDRFRFTDRLEDNELTSGQKKMMMSSPPPGVQTDADGLILPKKIINPCLESTDRKQLHRELKFNTKVGKNVLNQKSELQRVYEKQKERQLQQAQDSATSPTSCLKDELSRVIMERAQKQEQQPRIQDSDEEDKQYVNPEYLNARARLRAGQRSELK